MNRALAIIEQANSHILEYLSRIPSFGTLPEQRPEQSGYGHLEKLVDETNRAYKRMHGGSVGEVPAISFVHVVYVEKKSRNMLKTPLNRAFGSLPFFDTS